MAKVRVEKIKVGDCVGTPGDRKVRTVWGRVTQIEHDAPLVIFHSPDWVSESAKRYGRTTGSYTARRGESLQVSATRCTLGRRR